MRIAVNGACGRMGRVLASLIEACPRHSIAALVDVCGTEDGIQTGFDGVQADVVIDFSHHSAVYGLLDWAEAHHCPAVICTTGHDGNEMARIRDAAKRIPVFHSGNMSVGVALLCRLARETARLFPEADVEIVEIHHRHKKDAPSGTAKMLAAAVQQARDGGELVCGRSGMQPRTRDEIGIHSLRMGEIVGIHEVHLSTPSQTISLKHEAHSRALFAEGAICASEFLTEQAAGLYDMQSMV